MYYSSLLYPYDFKMKCDNVFKFTVEQFGMTIHS